MQYPIFQLEVRVVPISVWQRNVELKKTFEMLLTRFRPAMRKTKVNPVPSLALPSKISVKKIVTSIR